MLWSANLTLSKVQQQCDLVVEGKLRLASQKGSKSFAGSRMLNWILEPAMRMVRQSKAKDLGPLDKQLENEGFWSYPGDFLPPRKGTNIVAALVRDDLSRQLMVQCCSPFALIEAESGKSLHSSKLEEDYGPIEGGLPMWVQPVEIRPRSQQLINAMATWNRAGLRMDTSGTDCDVYVCFHYRPEWKALGPFTMRYPKNMVLGRTQTTEGNRRTYISPGGKDWFMYFNSQANWNHRNNPPTSDEYDLESVALHELGHGLGLAHSPRRANVMYPSIAAGEMKRELTQNDIDRARGHYY